MQCQCNRVLASSELWKFVSNPLLKSTMSLFQPRLPHFIILMRLRNCETSIFIIRYLRACGNIALKLGLHCFYFCSVNLQYSPEDAFYNFASYINFRIQKWERGCVINLQIYVLYLDKCTRQKREECTYRYRCRVPDALKY